MIKSLIFLLSIFYLLSSITLSFAVTPQATESGTEDPTQKIKEKLIENIASRVAELKLVEKRGIVGTVSEVSNTQITISDLNNNIRFIDVDELTRFSSPSNKESFGISDISKGTTLSILGLYNKESRRLLARFVNVISMPKFIHGFVNSINSNIFTVIVSTRDGKEIALDVEATTKTFAYTKDTGLKRSGFSKIAQNYTILAVGFADAQNKDKILSTAIIIFPEITKNAEPQ